MSGQSPQSPRVAPAGEAAETSPAAPLPASPAAPAAAREAGLAPAAAADFDARGQAKHLLRAIRSGALATLDGAGAPFVTLVNVATAPDGAPILLMSTLAAHTAHLEARAACSLLLAQTGKGDPLAHPRLTVSGQCRRVADPALRARFLARHPKAALYADFADFSFWRLTPTAFHLNGGFARAAGLTAEETLTDCAGAEALLAAEAGALAHLNADHAEALRLFAATAGEKDGRWRATGIDPEGIDLACGERTARAAFPAPVHDGDGLRRTLSAMAAASRAAGAAGSGR